MADSSFIKSIPAAILSFEFFFGGVGRVSPFPFRRLHEHINIKNASIAPILYPVVPFKDVKNHNRWVGAWMIATGALLALPNTRGEIYTLGLVLFWTVAGAYSQSRARMPFWLPVCNSVLGCLVHWLGR